MAFLNIKNNEAQYKLIGESCLNGALCDSSLGLVCQNNFCS